jgi:hypothetical protein
VDADQGSAFVIVILAIAVMSAVGGGLALSSTTESAIAANFRSALEVEYAADAAFDRALSELAVADWNAVLAGLQVGFTDGPPVVKQIASGVEVNLPAMVNRANCAKDAPCTDAQMDAVTSVRPWGANNPRWALYAYGPFGTPLPGAGAPCCYGVVLAADDPTELDGMPLVDTPDPDAAGHRVIALRIEAVGTSGAHTVREVALAAREGRFRVLAWRSRGAR